MASQVTLGLTPAVKVLGLSSEEGRDVFVYRNKEKTEERVKSARGNPVWRHKVLVQISEQSDAIEASALLETPDPIGVLSPVSLEPGATITIAQGRDFDLRISVEGVVSRNKGGGA